MKSRSGWLLTREVHLQDYVREAGGEKRLAVIVTSRKITNKSVDDLVREAHLQDYGHLWPNAVTWEEEGHMLVLRTPLCDYRLTPITVYG